MSDEKQLEPSNLFENVLAAATQVPGVRIDREEFLRGALGKKFSPDVVEKAIQVAPAAAGIGTDEIEKIANESIAWETARVTGISAVAGIPGGLAMAATVPADVAQYFAHVLRVAQKLGYLYGWGDLFQAGSKELTDGARATLTLFIGVMFGAAQANIAIGRIAAQAVEPVAKRIAARPLTQGVVYPVVKTVVKYLGIQMNKQIFGKAVGKAIPIVGGAVSGGLTFATFRPMSRKLRDELAKQAIADPAFYKMFDPEKFDLKSCPGAGDAELDDTTPIEVEWEYEADAENGPGRIKTDGKVPIREEDQVDGESTGSTESLEG